MCGDILELREGCVLLEALGEVLGGLRVQAVVAEAADTGQNSVSAAADTWVRKRAHEAHLMDCKVVFTLSISVIALMPSAVYVPRPNWSSPQSSLPARL